MSNVVLNAPASSPPVNSVTLEITAEAETIVSLTTNPTGKSSVARIKLLYALLISEIKRIPVVAPPLPQTPEQIIVGLLTSMAASVALAEAAPDFA